MNDTKQATPCTGTTCPGTSRTCGCREGDTPCATPAACACGPQCPCGQGCTCAQS